MTVLDIRNLRTYFDTEEGTVRAVDGIDLSIEPGEIVGLVGESGSGKSVTASSIIDLVEPPGHIVEGEIQFCDTDIRSLSTNQLMDLRGGEISMVFQDPQNTFNPTQTVGRQLHDVLRTYRSGSVHPLIRMLGRDHSEEYRGEVIEMLDRVGIPNPEDRYSNHPHEFSGGMLQRVMIGMALLCSPTLVLADEPTTGLDVSIENQILTMFQDVVEEMDTAVLWITHDLSVVAKLCDRVVVMYAGKIMEKGSTEDVLTDPKNPYTQALLESIPRYDEPEEEMNIIEGDVPGPLERPQGCRFASRCPAVHGRCHESHPPMYNVDDQFVACYLADEGQP